MNKHNVILINGKRRSGKGLFSSELQKKLAKKYQNIYILSFAEPIKAITKPILEEIKWDGNDKEVVRPLWIAMGEVGRNIDSDIWCARTFNKIIEFAKKASEANQNSLFLIDDMRFPNELDYFKGNIQKVQKVVKPEDKVKVTAIRIEKFMDATKFVAGVDDNDTETSFDKLVNICFDYIIPQRILINEEGVPFWDNVSMMAETFIRNYLK
ncbi:hypothetical protein [Mycoplasma sp. Ms02]|uniref:hypothetical protein n=1 Tax=Mycoplasma sp. Ms02 TaxID=353851 RepID=UPI001C8AD52B|nr:hypothetical protein [Mycoplasma sp. Ms02]QZE12399.1 hypothetical protein K4L35_00185 [Mycoplasma sp. Ms02]